MENSRGPISIMVKGPKRKNLDSHPIWKSIAGLLPHKPWATRTIYLAALKVTVPNRLNHPFWDEDHVGYDWDICLEDCSATEFEVKRWGDTVAEANYYATYRAMDIIQFLRKRSTNSSFVMFSPAPPFPSDLDDSKPLLFARGLHNMWKHALDAFLGNAYNHSDFWPFAIRTLHYQASIYPEFRILLKYYEALKSPRHRPLILDICAHSDAEKP